MAPHKPEIAWEEVSDKEIQHAFDGLAEGRACDLEELPSNVFHKLRDVLGPPIRVASSFGS